MLVLLNDLGVLGRHDNILVLESSKFLWPVASISNYSIY